MIAWSDEQIDPLAPARGAVWGVLGGLAMWAAVIALVWWSTRSGGVR